MCVFVCAFGEEDKHADNSNMATLPPVAVGEMLGNFPCSELMPLTEDVRCVGCVRVCVRLCASAWAVGIYQFSNCTRCLLFSDTVGCTPAGAMLALWSEL